MPPWLLLRLPATPSPNVVCWIWARRPKWWGFLIIYIDEGTMETVHSPHKGRVAHVLANLWEGG